MRSPDGPAGSRLLIVVVMLLAMLFCAVLMPDMMLAALAGCSAIIAFVAWRRSHAPRPATSGPTLGRHGPVRFGLPRGNGPPVSFPLRV